MRAAPALLAAALLGAGPARALDSSRLELPKAALAPSLEPCPSKGPGFFRLPGSRSCTRVSGRVAADVNLRAGPGAPAPVPTTTAPTVSGRIAIDNRADSDLGEVRTYLRIGNGWR